MRTDEGDASAIGHWMVWKERCALGLCPSETRRALHSFARARFFRYAAAYAGATNVADPNTLTPEPPEAWHCFETHLRLRNTRAGKSYKEWLFARTGPEGSPSFDGIRSGAAVIMRDVVRERLRCEFGDRRELALDARVSVGAGEVALSLLELLPGPLDTRRSVEERDLDALAAAAAATAFASLNPRERAALLARELGRSLVDPDVLAVAGCGKTVLCDAYQNALRRLAICVRARHPKEDAATLAHLAVAVFEKVKTLVLQWGGAEPACARLFCSPGGGSESAGAGVIQQ